MKIQITIIGLGQIGASIGMALAPKSDLTDRIGYDVDPKVMRQAPKLGAVDKTSSNLLKELKTFPRKNLASLKVEFGGSCNFKDKL